MASRKSDPKQFEGRTGSPGKGQEEGRLERGQGSGNPKTDWDDAPRGGQVASSQSVSGKSGLYKSSVK